MNFGVRNEFHPLDVFSGEFMGKFSRTVYQTSMWILYVDGAGGMLCTFLTYFFLSLSLGVKLAFVHRITLLIRNHGRMPQFLLPSQWPSSHMKSDLSFHRNLFCPGVCDQFFEEVTRIPRSAPQLNISSY